MDSIERRVRNAIASTEAEGIKLSADGHAAFPNGLGIALAANHQSSASQATPATDTTTSHRGSAEL